MNFFFSSKFTNAMIHIILNPLGKICHMIFLGTIYTNSWLFEQSNFLSWYWKTKFC